MFWDNLRWFEMIWDFLRRFEIFWDDLRCFEIFFIFWDFTKELFHKELRVASVSMKNVDFRTFFVIFSKQILEDVLEGQKIEKKSPKPILQHDFGTARRNMRGPGER